MRSYRWAVLGCMCLGLGARDVAAQTIRGIVENDLGGRVANAAITLHVTSEAKPISLSADSAGRFSVRLDKPGEVRITVTALGHEAGVEEEFAVAANEIVTVRVTMRVTPVRLADLEVLARQESDLRNEPLRGFWERKEWGERIGAGRFLTAEDSRLANAGKIEHALASMGLRTYAHPAIPGALLVGLRSATPSLGMLMRSKQLDDRVLQANVTGGCAVLFFLDGVQLRDVYEYPLETYVSASAVAGVEVYRRPSELPAEFSGSDSRCGVVAIWTKRGDR